MNNVIANIDYINNIAIRLARNEYDADDLAQETCIRLLTCCKSNINKSFVYKVCKNLFIDQQRKKKEHLDLFDIPEKPEQKLNFKKYLNRFRDNYYYGYFILHYYYRLSYKDIAIIYDKPVNTVKSYSKKFKDFIRQNITIENI